ncbi:MAG: hypothetical protein AMXMBFR59_18700 [Rhodanobacteraceae bacterium]
MGARGRAATRRGTVDRGRPAVARNSRAIGEPAAPATTAEVFRPVNRLRSAPHTDAGLARPEIHDSIRIDGRATPDDAGHHQQSLSPRRQIASPRSGATAL